MKRGILYTIISCLTLCWLYAMTSCEIESHAKGNIDGNWHLEKIDTIDTGGTKDVSESLIFWGIQANFVQLRSYYDYEHIFILRFKMNEKTLFLYEPRFNDRDNHDPEVEDLSNLYQFGIYELNETFQIEKLSASKMILKSDKLRLHFEKF